MKKLIFFIVALVSSVSLAHADNFWTPLGPVGGVVGDFARSPHGDIYLAGGNGVYRSVDTGKTWRHVGMERRRIFSLATDSVGRVYAGCDSGRIYRSIDRGESWQEIIIPGIGDTFITNLSANRRGDIFAHINRYGIYYSSDSGNTWTHSFSYNDSYDKLWCLSLINDSTLFTGASDGSVFRSSNYGRTWTDAGVIMRRGRGYWVNVFAQTPTGDIIAGTDDKRTGPNGGLYRYDPVHNNWYQSSPDNYTIHTIITARDGVMYMGPHSLLRSLDSGRTWEDIGGYDSINAYGSICDAGEGVLLVGTSAGVYRSTDRGETWERAFEGLNAHYIINISITPEGHILAGTNTGIFTSEDRGNTWKHLGFTGTLVYMVGTTPGGDYIASLATQDENRVVRSKDRGNTWIPSSEGFFSYLPESPSYGSQMVSVRGRLFAAGQSGVYYSDDDGNTWTYVYYADHEGSDPLDGQTTGIAVTKGGIFYASTTYGGIYRSEDGLVWKNVFAEENNETYMVDVAVNSKDRIYVLGSLVAWDRIYVSDNGTTWLMHRWTRIDSVMETSELFIDQRDSIWVGTEEGVFRMEPKGGKAENISSGLMNLDVQTFAQDSLGYLYVGTLGGGMYRSAGPVAVSVSEREPDTAVASAVPNPAFDEVELRYRLPAAGRVRITITDELGRIVSTPVDEFQPAGEQQLQVPVQHLASGVYYFRIEAGSVVQTGVFTVVR